MYTIHSTNCANVQEGWASLLITRLVNGTNWSSNTFLNYCLLFHRHRWNIFVFVFNARTTVEVKTKHARERFWAKYPVVGKSIIDVPPNPLFSYSMSQIFHSLECLIKHRLIIQLLFCHIIQFVCKIVCKRMGKYCVYVVLFCYCIIHKRFDLFIIKLITKQFWWDIL